MASVGHGALARGAILLEELQAHGALAALVISFAAAITWLWWPSEPADNEGILSPLQRERVGLAQEYVTANRASLGIAAPPVIKSTALARLSCPLLSDANRIVESPHVARRGVDVEQGVGTPAEKPVALRVGRAELLSMQSKTPRLPADVLRRAYRPWPQSAQGSPKGLLALGAGGRGLWRHGVAGSAEPCLGWGSETLQVLGSQDTARAQTAPPACVWC